ncbi:MAG: 16S rRNA (uracil(1498)-N(3))-methyltransferase [Nocardioidaceae bacterium]|nr:16S rRNA (uracil(1498)-N(3))-methyltransferase [Nocardioidaceae bacterium]
MSVPVFWLPAGEIGPGAPLTLAGAEGHHAADVRRLRPGEAVELVDGAGVRACGRVASVEPGSLRIDVETVTREPAPAPRLVVVQALPKGNRGELAVGLLTEVGVDVIVPWAAARCVTQWRGERSEKALARWRSTAREAAKQSRRAWAPLVAPLATTAQVRSLVDDAALALVLHESAPGGLPDDIPDIGDVVVVVGPEGGVTDDELETFAAAHVVRMGESVLRTSTAGVVAAAALLSRTPRWG